MTEEGDKEEFNLSDLPPIEEPVPKKGLTVKELVEDYGGMAFNARRLARVANIWLRAVKDEDTRIYFTFAGAMVPAGLRRIVATAMEKGLIHAIATTGANMSHDGLQAFNMPHKRGSEEADDSMLRDEKVLRIHDIFICRVEPGFDFHEIWTANAVIKLLAQHLDCGAGVLGRREAGIDDGPGAQMVAGPRHAAEPTGGKARIKGEVVRVLE